LAEHEDFPAERVKLDGADCPPAKQFAAEYAATSACEKCQFIHSIPVYPAILVPFVHVAFPPFRWILGG
jgi:hypothetical protein